MTDTPVQPMDHAAHRGDFYESLPFPDTQPSLLAALAQLCGLVAPAVTGARVLELGCAGGGNLIPLAARYPAAEFLGIDLLPAHVAQAQARIAALGLRNVRVIQGDLAERQPLEGQYDYVLCHGVYSWAGPAAQAGIWSLLRQHLSANGVAYLSYNVWPGWHLRGAVRDLLLSSDDASLPSAERAARARRQVERVAAQADAATAYGQLMRHEAQTLARQADSYLIGEFLAPHNAPSHFSEMAARAQEAGLVFLCEAHLHASHPQANQPALDAAAREVAADPVGYQQQLDWLLGRAFRQSLWVRGERLDAAGAVPTADRLTGLHASATLRPQPPGTDAKGAAQPASGVVLRDAKGLSLTTNDPVVARALVRLGEQYPDTVPVADLLAQAEATEAGSSARLLPALLQAVMAGLVDVTSEPVCTGRASDLRPAVWSLARLEAAAGQHWVSNQRHAPVRVDVLGRALLQLADGRHTLAELADLLASALPELRRLDGARRQAMLAQALQHVATNALLEPAPRT